MQVGQSSSSGVSQQVHIEVLPSILLLRLKLLLYDTTKDGIVKISKSIQFTPDLEIPLGTISSFVFPGQSGLRVSRGSVDPEITAPVAGKTAEPAQYKLYGVLYHHGDSGGSGHYTVDVLHPNGDGGSGEGWLHIDDETVSVVQHEEIFGNHDHERGKDRCAYMLLYCRTAASTHNGFAS
jgi:ubiquitin carboxyl-terminal hydrolase 10